jgi:hypothetical protein
MFLSSLLSLKSIVSLSILMLSVGIGAFLYLTLDEDFEAQLRPSPRINDRILLTKGTPIDDISQIINTARQAWSIVDKK